MRRRLSRIAWLFAGIALLAVSPFVAATIESYAPEGVQALFEQNRERDIEAWAYVYSEVAPMNEILDEDRGWWSEAGHGTASKVLDAADEAEAKEPGSATPEAGEAPPRKAAENGP